MVQDLEVVEPGSTPAEKHKYENTALSPVWYAVMNVSPEINTLGQAQLTLRMTTTFGYTGTIPKRCKPFRGHGKLKSVRVMQDPFALTLVSFFDDKQGEEYFMVVNLVHDKDMSKVDGIRTVRLVFDEKGRKIGRLNRLTGLVETLRTEPFLKKERKLDFQLEGGTGDLFKWHIGMRWTLLDMP